MKFLIQELKTDRGKSRFYLRLEKDEVFQGWAVPKGLPKKGSKQRLALEVGPFKLEAAGFEGRVEKSKFGPGTISIVDQGEYRTLRQSNEKIMIHLSGSRIQGIFALVRFENAGPDGWLLSQPRQDTARKYTRKSSKDRESGAGRLSRSGLRFVLESEKKDHTNFRKRKPPTKPKKRYFIFDAPRYKLLPWVYFVIFVILVIIFLKIFIAGK